jgi:hypothetical protein
VNLGRVAIEMRVPFHFSIQSLRNALRSCKVRMRVDPYIHLSFITMQDVYHRPIYVYCVSMLSVIKLRA